MTGSLLVLPIAVLAAWVLFNGGTRLWRWLHAASRADWGRDWLNALDGVNRIFCHRFHRLPSVRIELPNHGPALVVANHVSGLDPLLLIASCDRPLRFIIAREQYERAGLTWLLRAVGCIPVDRSASPHRALALARQALRQGEVVALFPFGRIHLDGEGPLRIKPGIRHLASQSGAPVFPVRIDGIAGEGRTISAVWKRSRARISAFQPVRFDPQDPDSLLARLSSCLMAQENPLPGSRHHQSGNKTRHRRSGALEKRGQRPPLT